MSSRPRPGAGSWAACSPTPPHAGGLARAVAGFVLDDLVARHGRAALMVLTGNAPAVAAYERLGMAKRLFGAAQIPPPR